MNSNDIFLFRKSRIKKSILCPCHMRGTMIFVCMFSIYVFTFSLSHTLTRIEWIYQYVHGGWQKWLRHSSTNHWSFLRSGQRSSSDNSSTRNIPDNSYLSQTHNKQKFWFHLKVYQQDLRRSSTTSAINRAMQKSFPVAHKSIKFQHFFAHFELHF